ncbi:MAG: hypothetical protein NTV94_04070 [Planctomycetota bacterium]|nr:hypothetical protein [Planctomycetota bacterium]
MAIGAGALMVILCAAAAEGANAYTALRVELSTDDLHWSQSLQVTPGSELRVRVVASYEGRGSVNGLAWVNFQPVITNWWGVQDRVLPFITTGNQSQGAVAFDKPQVGQAAYGRIYPFATNALGVSSGGFDTTLTTHLGSVNGNRQCRIAQSRTTNPIGEGPTSGLFAFNNTSGAGGIVCSQPPSESAFPGLRSTLNADIILFKFGIVVDPSLTERNMSIALPLGGVSKFGMPQACAGWFTDANQSAAGVTYVAAYSRAAALTVRGAVPGVGVPAVGCGALCVLASRRRR